MNVSTVTNHFSTANKGFITTLGSSILSGATTIPLTSVSGLTNGTIFVGIIEPGLSNEQEFTGTVDTAGVQITGVKWTDGTDVDHTAGVTIVDYVAATDWNMNTKGLLVSHDQDGTLKAGAVDVAGVLASNVVTYPKLESELQGGWNSTSALPAISTVVANGNRSYDVTFASDVSSTLSEGMRLQFTKTVAGNGYMGGAFNGSSHYFTKTSPSGTLGTVTNNFTIEAVVQPTVYQAGPFCGRSDATRANSFGLEMTATGAVRAYVFNGGTGNYRYIDTSQSLPLNKKTHIAMSWASGTILIYLDGISVPLDTVATAGTNPTTAGTGGDFSIGRSGAHTAAYFHGYISNVAVFDAVLSAATIKQHATYKLLGSETNCIGAWSLDNTANDQSSAGNNLTATGGVGFTAQSPHGQLGNGVETTKAVGLVMSVSGSTAVVQVPEGCTIPTTGGITSVAYSTQANPFGFPKKPIAQITAITQSDFTTTTTPGIVDISGLSIPYTATGKETIRLKLNPYYLATSGAAATFVQLYIRDGSTTIATKGFSAANANYAQTPAIDIEYQPTAGAHTFVASCSQNAAATLTVASAAGAPAIFSLEVL